MQRHNDSHLDHHLTDAQIAHILERFADRRAFFIETLTLPRELGTVPCGLYGPLTGDSPIAEAEVTYAPRGTRAWKSRLIDLPARHQHELTVIAGPHDGIPCVLFTAFGGPVAPREPADIRREMETLEEQRRGFYATGKGDYVNDPDHAAVYAKIVALRVKRAEADAFWAQHALAKE